MYVRTRQYIKIKLYKFFWLFFLIFLYPINSTNSHSGRTNAEGCHNQKSNNSYHCHKSKSYSSNSANQGQLKVVDGDTIHIGEKKIRFSGIDTPEIKQTCTKNGQLIYCGLVAQKILKQKIADQYVSCVEEQKPDRYQRVLAECFVNNESLSRYMVRSGYAFAYRKYSIKFVQDENYAKENTLGLWKMMFEYPWDYRKTIK